MLIGALMNVQNKAVLHTSEIIVNANGRVLAADKAFCEIFGCKKPGAVLNSIFLDLVAEESRKTMVNAFIDAFYGNKAGKLFEINMLDFNSNPLEVTINFFPIKGSNGSKATLLIRKKMF